MNKTRRAFLRELGCGTLTATAVMAGLDHLFLMNALAAPVSPADYKALVCIFLFGGNDANNTVVPIDDYAQYAAVRGGLTIPQTALLPIHPPSDGRTFGLHPSLGGLLPLWQQQKVGVVTNVGPLLAPLTQSTYLSNPALRPYQLFSHADQQDSWQTASASGPDPTGWGGRAADLTRDAASSFPTITSLSGVTIFSAGVRTQPLTLPPAPTPLTTALALKRPGDSANGSAFRQLLALGQAPTSPTLIAEAANVSTDAVTASLALSVDPTLTTAFPTTSLGNQLKQVAKVIKLSLTQLGLRRQIFFCSLGGFDTHANQGADTGTQAGLLQALGDAMGAFYSASVELGVPSGVTTFTMSDFSRTFKPAGSGSGTGSDHAWGAHHFVMGGAVAGGDFYGEYPTLALGGADDADTGTGARGRWIPTTAVDQYGATLAAWFGVAPSDLGTVFPNIGRFAAPSLGFMIGS